MNPVTLTPSPSFFPNVCIRCGVGAGPSRTYFIDLGILLTGYFNPMMDGAIYYCNECAANLISDINREVAKWHQDHSPWESPDRVEASYDWEKEIDLSEVDLEIEQRRNSAGRDTEPEQHDPGTEQSNSITTAAVTVSEPAVLTIPANAGKLDIGFST